jgi:adhesin/invasin
LASSASLSSIVADGSSTTVISATVQDVNGNTVKDATNQVTFSLTGQGTLIGSNPATPVNGVATITLRSGTLVASATVSATAGGLTGSNVKVDMVAGSASKLVSSVSPTSITADGTTTSLISIQVQDANGNIVTSYSNAITFNLTGVGTLEGTNPVSAVNGLASITLRSGTLTGSATVQSTSGALTVGSSYVNQVAGAAYKLVSSVSLASIVANGITVSTISVQVQDVNSNLVTTANNLITFNLTGVGGLEGTNPVNATSGIAKIVLRTTTLSGSATIQTTSGVLIAGSSYVNETAGAPVKLIVNGIPYNIKANGVSISTVTARVCDSNGNTVPSATNSINFGITSGNGTLVGSNPVSAVAGVASIQVKSTVNPSTIAINATTSGLTTGTTNVVTYLGAADHMVVEATPSVLATNGVDTVQIKGYVKDSDGDTVTTSNIPVTFNVNSPYEFKGTNPVNAVSGVASIVLATTTTQGVAIVNGYGTGVSTGTKNVTCSAIGIALYVGLRNNNSSIAANGVTVSTITAVIYDVMGDTVTSATNWLTFSIESGNGTLEGTNPVAAVAGVGKIVLRSTTISGVASVNAVSEGLTTGTTVVNVIAANANKLVCVATNSNLVADGVSEVDINAKVCDTNSNVVSTATDNVTFNVTGEGVLVGANPAAAVNGIATIKLRSTTKTGTINVGAASGSLTNGSVNVTSIAGAANKLVVGNNAGIIIADGLSVSTVTANICDINGNIVTSADNFVTFSVSGNGSLDGANPKRAVNGVASIRLKSTTTLGSALVSASVNGLTSGSTTVYTIGGTANKLILSGSPTSITAGGVSVSTVSVMIQDVNGNLVGTATDSITFIATGKGTIDSTNPVAAVNGVAKVVIRSTTLTGNVTIYADSGSMTQGKVILPSTAGSATKLVSSVNNSSITADGTSISTVTITIQDANSNAVTTANNQITFTVSGNGVLDGANPATAVNGVATIRLKSTTITGSATVYATASGLTDSSSYVNTVAGSANRLDAMSTLLSMVSDGVSVSTITATIYDINGNVVKGATNLVTFSVIGNGALEGTNPVNAVDGIATIKLEVRH